MVNHDLISKGERGFALVVALLVTVILALLGSSLILMAKTENRISENERLDVQALYAAEAGIRVVKGWFDHPISLVNLANPNLAMIDRTLRMINADGNPATIAIAADGTVAKPYYKQDVDENADGSDDIFDKPYRGSLADTLLGTETGPDMRIDAEASSAAKTYLNDLSEKMFSQYPGTGLEARIVRIDIYAPPSIETGGTWTRYGMATVKVIARLYKLSDAVGEEVLSERMVRVVLNELPYGPGGNGPGPLHSCDTLDWNGEFNAHWGAVSSVSSADIHNNHLKQPVSIPRVVTGDLQVDLLWGYNDDVAFTAYKNIIEDLRVEDPWLRLIFGGALADAPNSDTQPWPFTWTPGDALSDGDLPYHPGPPGPHPYPTAWDGSHSNVFQHTPVTCINFDYTLWKSIAQAGGQNVHYYVWDSGSSFKENGSGPARTFESITDNQTGFFFFDTMDRQPPRDDDADGIYDNLTPMIKIAGGTWGVRGMLYLNTIDFQSKGVSGRPVTFNAPGEPFQDKNLNGQWDFGEDWINLDYPDSLGDPFVADVDDFTLDDGTTGGVAVHNSRGPDIIADAVLWGILFNNGYYDATGNAVYYGTVISKLGIGFSSPSGGTADHYWDASLGDGPPDEWGLPRVSITRWETDI
jgi:hypothetical protein